MRKFHIVVDAEAHQLIRRRAAETGRTMQDVAQSIIKEGGGDAVVIRPPEKSKIQKLIANIKQS